MKLKVSLLDRLRRAFYPIGEYSAKNLDFSLVGKKIVKKFPQKWKIFQNCTFSEKIVKISIFGGKIAKITNLGVKIEKIG